MRNKTRELTPLISFYLCCSRKRTGEELDIMDVGMLFLIAELSEYGKYSILRAQIGSIITVPVSTLCRHLDLLKSLGLISFYDKWYSITKAGLLRLKELDSSILANEARINKMIADVKADSL